MMTSSRRKLLAFLLRTADLAMLTIAYLGAAAVAYGIYSPTVLRNGITEHSVFTYTLCFAAWNFAYSICGLNHSRRLTNYGQDLKELTGATLLVTALTGLIAWLFRSPVANTGSLIVFETLAVCLLCAWRVSLRGLLGRVRRKGRNLRHLVIVGTNERALEFARTVESQPALGFRVRGFVDDHWEGIERVLHAGYPIVSTLGNFREYLRNEVVDEVAICLPMQSMYADIHRTASACVEQGIMTRVFADFMQQRMTITRTDHFEGRPVLTVSSHRIDGAAALVKWALDSIIALALLIILSPVLLVTALLIRLTSTGPILFRQKRLGINKRVFEVLKFRTMTVDAEERIAALENANEVEGPVFKIRNDPRVTPVGRILRKLSIDELPQLVNVLRGDMSLVGPRPLPVRDYKGFSEHWHLRRFSVRPGISCLWQVQGRSSIPFDRWMELDMQYIDHWSLWLDLKIMLKTVPAVLRGEGAS